jgi:hypothetical protein
MTNGERYKNAFNKVAEMEMKPINIRSIKKKHRQTNHFATVAAAIICVLLIGGTAYAMGKYFGILDFTSRHAVEEFSEDGLNLIENNIQETLVDESDESFINCTVKEALCDSETITIVFEVSAKEKNKYLFVPADALPDDNMFNWSDITEVTAQEYATEKQLQIVNISGTITNDDELGIDSQSMDFYALDDDVMYIYVRCNKESSVKNFDVSWLTTANIYSENIQFDDVVRSTITFTLEDISTLTQIEYLPNSSNLDMQCEIIKAEISQTEIGTYVDIYYTDTQQISNDGLTFRLVNPNGEAYQSVGGSGIIYQEDGSCMERIIMNKTNLEDTIIVEAFNCYDKTVYGRIEMSKLQ